MVLPSKTRLGKRKLEIKEVRKEKQVTASKKHDKKCFAALATSTKEEISVPMKPKTKSDLENEMELMKQLNDALLEEVKNNEEAIVILEGREKRHIEAIKSLEEKLPKLVKETYPKSSIDFGTQTSLDPGDFETQIPCSICIYVATCEEQLNWHMDDEHDIKTDLFYETDFPCEICGKFCRTEEDLKYHLEKHEFGSHSCEPHLMHNEIEMLVCNFCENKFETKKDLMVHKKKEHREKVRMCWNYSTGKCEFVENVCWFLHTNTSISAEVDCNLCGKVFLNIDQLSNHKKIEHVISVQHCKNEKSNGCKYGDQKCWYRHDSQADNNINNVNEEVIEKIFNMMEQFTNRILTLENLTK